MSILGELQSYNGSSWVELFVLDNTNNGGDITYFHAGVNEKLDPVVWQGTTYTPLPIQASGFGYTGTGSPPRPKLSVANVQGLISALVRDFNDLLGAKVTRKRTMVKYLDAVNFTSGNPTADSTQYLPDEVFYVVQKTAENKMVVEFELGSALDLHGMMIPRRQIIANLCAFRYRGEECGYTGGAVADATDTPTTVLADDVCSKKVTGCKLRFGATAELPFGGFVASSLVGKY